MCSACKVNPGCTWTAVFYAGLISYTSTALIKVLLLPPNKQNHLLLCSQTMVSWFLHFLLDHSSCRVIIPCPRNPNLGVQWTPSFDGRVEEEMQMTSPSSSHDLQQQRPVATQTEETQMCRSKTRFPFQSDWCLLMQDTPKCALRVAMWLLRCLEVFYSVIMQLFIE